MCLFFTTGKTRICSLCKSGGSVDRIENQSSQAAE